MKSHPPTSASNAGRRGPSTPRSIPAWARLAALAVALVLSGCSDTRYAPHYVAPWFDAVGGLSANDVYAVGSSTVWHYDGRDWLPQSRRPAGFLNGIWGAAADNVYAVWSSPDGGSTGRVYRFDGRAWSLVASSPAALQSVWGTSGSDVFAVGREGTILHYDGLAWSAYSTGRGEWLAGVWGSSPQDVYAVGYGDSILHYDGVRWTREYTGQPSLAVWGSSGDDIFAVGGSRITHYDGVQWTPQASGTTNNLFAVWGSSSHDVFAVGFGGTILHYDGTAWSPQPSGTTGHLYGVWGSSARDVFAVGQEVILHYDGTRWRRPLDSPSLTVDPAGARSMGRLAAP